MTPNCSYVLDNQAACRCPALHGDRFCRHHTPAALARRRHPTPKNQTSSNPKDSTGQAGPLSPSCLRGYWRSQHRWIAALTTLDGLGDCLEMILGALESHDISPRSAGRLIAAILTRKTALKLQAQNERLRATMLVRPSFLRSQAHSTAGSAVQGPQPTTLFP